MAVVRSGFFMIIVIDFNLSVCKQRDVERQYSGRFTEPINLIASLIMIFSSNIIQDVMGHCETKLSSAMAYFYFDFQDREKQQCQGLIRSLITQFSDQCKTTPEALERLYSKFEPRGQQPDLDELATTLNRILQEFQQAYIIVDALDECTEWDALLKLIEDVLDWKMSTLHI